MTLAAHQPNFLPNLAFFNKMKLSDKFVIITNLQFEKQEGWQRRHKIPGPNGDIWLTVPVLGSQNQMIKDVKINKGADWKKKHKRTLETVYSKTKEKEILRRLTDLYVMDYERLADLNIAAIMLIRDVLEIETPVEVDEEVSGSKHELLINLCKKYNADTYISGVGAMDYMTDDRLDALEKNNISHIFINRNLTAQYPYTTVHYLLTEGRGWVKDVITD